MNTIHPLLSDFSWSRLGKPVLSVGQMAAKGRSSLSRLNAWGVALPSGNRLERAVETLERSSQTERFLETSPDDMKHLAGESARMVLELYIATKSTQERPNDVACGKLLRALDGRLDARPGDPCAARDAQFELYVWGLFNAGGINCEFEEPDLTFAFEGERAGIAVKRLWSPKQARKRLSKAARQIVNAGLRGIVAINAQEFITAEATVGSLQEKGEAFNRALHRLHGHLSYVARKEHLLGLLVCGTAFSWQRSDNEDASNTFRFATYNQLVMMTRDDAEEGVVKSFFGRQEAALQLWMRHNL